ncbi:MAG: MFS transporter [Verrucomicrobia bacterium GWF2_51_19]|nr:MAG: MFS transporter [Verrucomicrobia bacterium GWF2_51_19]HCJ11745.1 MFS transporter [Opitutae bacterium]
MGLLNLLINIVIPSVLLMKGHAWFDLSPNALLGLALAFPIAYGLWQFSRERKWNLFSIIGLVSVLLTGGIGVLALPKEWVAFKEALVPLVIGTVVVVSLKTPYPLIRTLLFNEQLLQVSKIERRLQENQQQGHFEKLLKECTWWLAASFLLSSGLNYGLAKYLIRSDTGTAQFAEELGRMTAMSYPVIVVPCSIVMIFALWKLIAGVRKLTGLQLAEVLLDEKSK